MCLLIPLIRILVHWVGMYKELRNIPRPKERWPFSLVLDMWQALSQMDPHLELTASKYDTLTYKVSFISCRGKR